MYLGWVLLGLVYKVKEISNDFFVFLNNIYVLRSDIELVEENDCLLKEELWKFWNIEVLGIAFESEDLVY